MSQLGGPLPSGKLKKGLKVPAMKKKKKEEEGRKVWKEHAGSQKRRKFLKIGAALAELAGGTDYAKEAASGDPLKIGNKDLDKKKKKKKKKDTHGGKSLTVKGEY